MEEPNANRSYGSFNSNADNSPRQIQFTYYQPTDTAVSIPSPRPCYYMLRLLGIWQPKDSNNIVKLYSYFMWIGWCACFAFIFVISYIHNPNLDKYEVLNSIGTIVDFCCPFLFFKYYFGTGNYDRLLHHVYENIDENGIKKLRFYRYIYTALSIFVWCVMVTFFTVHWRPFAPKKVIDDVLYEVASSLTLVYSLGWWSSWLTLYCFVCHVHKYQFDSFAENVKHDLQEIEPESIDDIISVKRILTKFHDLHHWLNHTQRDFSVIISLAVAYHIYDIIVFTLAFFKLSFGPNYNIWQFVGTILFDLFSILIKLYPAAIMYKSVNKLVFTVGNLCSSDYVIPFARIRLYQYLFQRKRDMGFYILGINITVKKTVTIFVFVATFTVTFLRIFIPISSKIKVK